MDKFEELQLKYNKLMLKELFKKDGILYQEKACKLEYDYDEEKKYLMYGYIEWFCVGDDNSLKFEFTFNKKNKTLKIGDVTIYNYIENEFNQYFKCPFFKDFAKELKNLFNYWLPVKCKKIEIMI